MVVSAAMPCRGHSSSARRNATGVMGRSRGRLVLAVIVAIAVASTAPVASTTATVPGELTGPNVCTSVETHTEKTTVVEYKVISSKLQYFCIRSWIFKCFKNITNVIPINTERMIDKYEVIKECCEGYDVSPDGTHCRPVCDEPCIQGTCISPNVCKCNRYYEGSTCNKRITCPSGMYGFECRYSCRCQNNSSCDPLDGICHCPPGYSGKYCEFICTSPMYGHNCKNRCKCQNGATCNPINGFCTCLPGYVGKFCSYSCPPSLYGDRCQYECNCRNGHGGSCNPINGVCHCAPGWTGHDCKTFCSPGTFGKNCSSTCRCWNGATCRVTDGVCLCAPGFYGPECSEACPKNDKGEICLNPDTEICDPISGCICDFSRPNNNCTTVLQLERRYHLFFDISIILTFLIMTTLCAGIWYFYYNRYQKFTQTDNNNVELRRRAEANAAIAFISTAAGTGHRDVRNVVSDLENPKSYTNETFVIEYAGTDGAGEHVYFEIDEITPERRVDPYDHLDFLRPTGSWKPHYQKALTWQEKSAVVRK